MYRTTKRFKCVTVKSTCSLYIHCTWS